jgi:hypothetical protein
VLRKDWQARAQSRATGLAEDAPSALARERISDPAYDKVAETFQLIGLALTDLWLPRLKLALAEAAVEGIEDLAASTAQHRSPGI